MTHDTLNPEAIRADMKSGTPGPWRAERPDFAGGWWVVFTDPDTGGMIDASGDGGFDEITARRIARLPDLERGYLDMRARAEAAEAVLCSRPALCGALEYDEGCCEEDNPYAYEPARSEWRAGWKAARDACCARAEAAEATLADAIHLLWRYRHETPLGHQPQMIAESADRVLSRAALTDAQEGGTMCDKAYHTDVEKIAKGLDQMVAGAEAIGIGLPRIERAADMLRRQSQIAHALEQERDDARDRAEAAEALARLLANPIRADDGVYDYCCDAVDAALSAYRAATKGGDHD